MAEGNKFEVGKTYSYDVSPSNGAYQCVYVLNNGYGILRFLRSGWEVFCSPMNFTETKPKFKKEYWVIHWKNHDIPTICNTMPKNGNIYWNLIKAIEHHVVELEEGQGL